MVSKFVVFTMIVCTASAATWYGKLPAKPKELADKEGCYIDEIKDVIPFGTSLTPTGICYRIDCSKEYINYDSCGKVATDDPECHVTTLDLSKPYPHCCPDIKCDIDNNLFQL